MDFKLTLFSLSTDTSPQALAEAIVDNYGEDFDAARGDFVARRVDNTVEVYVKDVAKGDMRMLVDDIYRDFGDEDDSMLVRTSRAEGKNWFEIDLADDDA